jgi:hypothetical protein
MAAGADLLRVRGSFQHSGGGRVATLSQPVRKRRNTLAEIITYWLIHPVQWWPLRPINAGSTVGRHEAPHEPGDVPKGIHGEGRRLGIPLRNPGY